MVKVHVEWNVVMKEQQDMVIDDTAANARDMSGIMEDTRKLTMHVTKNKRQSRWMMHSEV